MKFRVIYLLLLVQDSFAKMSNSLGSVWLRHNSLRHFPHLIRIWRVWRWNVCKEIGLLGFILRIYFHWWNLHVENLSFFFVTGINYIVGKKDFFGFCQVTIQSFGPSWMRIVSSIELFFFLFPFVFYNLFALFSFFHFLCVIFFSLAGFFSSFFAFFSLVFLFFTLLLHFLCFLLFSFSFIYFPIFLSVFHIVFLSFVLLYLNFSIFSSLQLFFPFISFSFLFQHFFFLCFFPLFIAFFLHFSYFYLSFVYLSIFSRFSFVYLSFSLSFQRNLSQRVTANLNSHVHECLLQVACRGVVWSNQVLPVILSDIVPFCIFSMLSRPDKI